MNNMFSSKPRVEFRSTEDAITRWAPQHGGADAEAHALRERILNTEDTHVIAGTTYYVSPNGDDANDGISPQTAWQTVDAINDHRDRINAGDGVLFERGYVYRRKTPLVAKSGVTYGAFGKGAKPALYGSAANYALSDWKQTDRENVWQLSLDTREGGIAVFNHGFETGTPKYYGVDELVKNGDFHHDFENGTFYLYLDKGNPASVYDDIEIGTRGDIISVPRDAVNVTIDNLALKYAGLFAVIAQENTRGVHITNCEIGWVGGCRFMKGKVGLGNCISFWKNTADASVENCWLYQAYDAGITPQGVTEAHTYKDLVFRNNLIEYCNYSIEVFDRIADSVWDGLVIEDNILRFAGYGFMPMNARPDSRTGVSHFLGWTWNYNELSGKGVVIRNNIFDCSAGNLVFWSGKTYESGLTVSDNSFYQKANATGKAVRFAEYGQRIATDQTEFEAAVREFDPNAKTVQWLP